MKYKVSGMELEDASKDALKQAAQSARDDGLTVEIGGDALSAVPETGATEVIGIAIAAVVLVITFGSLVAAGLPLLTALIGVGIGVSTITALANALDLGSTTSTLAMMIGLAVGIDYALFIVSRYRAELAEGREREEAAGRAVGTAGSAVVFAGLTVVIALVGLAVVNIPMLTKMGVAAAGTVAIAVLIALTLIPALLGYAGRKVKPAGEKAGCWAAAGPPRQGQAEHGNALGELRRAPSGRRPAAGRDRTRCRGPPGVPAGAGPAGRRFAADGHDTAPGLRPPLGGLRPGFNGPLMVVVDAKSSEHPKAAVATVTDDIKGMRDVVTVTPPTYNASGDTAMITVVPGSKPSSATTEDLVHGIRGAGAGITADTGAKLLVTGLDGDEHRRIAEAERRADPVSGAGGGSRLPPADRGLPLDPGPAEGGARLPALGDGGARCGGRGVPVGLAVRAVGRRERPAPSCR